METVVGAWRRSGEDCFPKRLEALVELRRRMNLSPLPQDVVDAVLSSCSRDASKYTDHKEASLDAKQGLLSRAMAVMDALRDPPSIPCDNQTDIGLRNPPCEDDVFYIHGCLCPVEMEQATAFELEDDFLLSRYLRAREFNSHKAELMLRQCLQWRESHHIDHCLRRRDPTEILWQSFAPTDHYGHDRLGRPVVIERVGVVRPGKILKYLEKEDFMARHSRLMEIVLHTIEQARHRFGSHVTQHVVIMDLKNLSFKPHPASMGLFRQTIEIDQNYYPETLGALFLINAPSVFTTLWPMIRPFIDTKTRQKVHVIGGNYQETLFTHIDPRQLPKEYGGTCTKPFPSAKEIPSGWSAPPIAERRHAPITSDIRCEVLVKNADQVLKYQCADAKNQQHFYPESGADYAGRSNHKTQNFDGHSQNSRPSSSSTLTSDTLTHNANNFSRTGIGGTHRISNNEQNSTLYTNPYLQKLASHIDNALTTLVSTPLKQYQTAV